MFVGRKHGLAGPRAAKSARSEHFLAVGVHRAPFYDPGGRRVRPPAAAVAAMGERTGAAHDAPALFQTPTRRSARKWGAFGVFFRALYL